MPLQVDGRPGEACAGASAASLQDIDESEASLDRRLVSYYFASRRAASSCSTIGFAVDAGRVSKRGNFVGVFVTPDNVAFWAPPQVAPARRSQVFIRNRFFSEEGVLS
jgi:hypothetical protein